jgi:glycosyltransferase involved in cell wall biosynthesis
MATVSIIIPAHDPGPYLRQALRSVHKQSCDDWEAIVVDDNSREDLSWVPLEFPRVRWLRQRHGGASVARNTGILHTTGELIAFMDQDDLWRPEKLCRQLDAMHRESEAALCHCELDFIGPDDTLEAMGSGAASDALPVVVLDGSAPSDEPGGESRMLRSLRYFAKTFAVPSTVMVRRASLATSGLLDPFIPFFGDYDLLIKLGGRHKVVRVPTQDVLYRRHSNNFSGQIAVRVAEARELTRRYVAYAQSQGDDKLSKEAPQHFGSPRHMLGTHAFELARRHFQEGRYRAVACEWARSVYFFPAYSLPSTIKWLLGRRLTTRDA